jgi:hypothetical protein
VSGFSFDAGIYFKEAHTDFEPPGCLDLFSHRNDCTDRFVAGNLRQSRAIHPITANVACLNEYIQNHNVVDRDSPFPDLIVGVAPTGSADLDEEIVVAILWNWHFDNVQVFLKLRKRLVPLGYTSSTDAEDEPRPTAQLSSSWEWKGPLLLDRRGA